MYFNVTGVVDQYEGSGNFLVLVERQRIYVHWNGVSFLSRGGLLGGEEFAYSFILASCIRYSRGVQRQGRCKSRRNRQDMARSIVNRNPFQVLALCVTFHQALQVFFLAPVQHSFNTFLKAVREDFGAARKVIPQDAALVPDLVTGENKRHTGDAHDQGQDNFQSRAHLSSSIQKMKMDREGLGVCGHVEPRITCFSFLNGSVLAFSSPRFQGRGMRDNNVYCDVSAIRRTILHRGLRTDCELAFDFGIAVNQELDGLSFLTFHDFQ